MPETVLSSSESVLIEADMYWEDELDALQMDSIGYLRLSTRPSNCLARAGIKTISELLTYSEKCLLKMPDFGQGSLDEIIERLYDLDLFLEHEESQATWQQNYRVQHTNHLKYPSTAVC